MLHESSWAPGTPGMSHNIRDIEEQRIRVTKQYMKAAITAALATLFLMQGISTVQAAQVILPRTGITADDVALLINDNDPVSIQTGEYYREKRKIPDGNVIHLRIPSGRSALNRKEFAEIRAEIERATPAHIQAYAVAWTSPYRVGCMSLTSALAFGFDDAYCSASCGPTRTNPYFNSPSLYPSRDHRMRPAMMLAGNSFAQIKALIDRGVASDRTSPNGRAYLLDTPDKTRSVRALHFASTARELAGVFPMDVLETGAIEDRHDVMFYFTGLAQVPQLKTLGFLPGALADHLTSFGGQLTDSSQMSSLRWLEAGATASYGTVVEPCNHPQKFPFPAIAMHFYATGATAMEAYWKSVAWPGEGVFIGEPLARPFAPRLQDMGDGKYSLALHSPFAAILRIARSASPTGPYSMDPGQTRSPAIRRGRNLIRFALPADGPEYVQLKIIPAEPPKPRKESQKD